MWIEIGIVGIPLIIALTYAIYHSDFSTFKKIKYNEPEWSIVNLVGESFENEDGMPRQTIIKSLSAGEPLQLIAETDNPYSKSGRAVAVHSRLGKIGYIGEKDKYQKFIFKRLIDSLKTEAKILNIFPPTRERKFYAVTLDIHIDIRNEERRLDRKKEKSKNAKKVS